MYLRDRPLLPDGIDRRLYVQRQELEEAVLAPLRQSRNVLLLGAAGSGKSTLMRFVAGKLVSEQFSVSWINAALARGTEELLSLIEAEIGARRDPSAAQDEAARGEEGLSLGATRLVTHAHLLRLASPRIICLDGLTDPEAGFDVFGRLRDELWAAGHTWLVAVRPQEAVSLRTPPADAFWGSVVEIPTLTSDELQQLLALGLDDNEQASLRWPQGQPLREYPREVIHQVQAALSGPDLQPRVDRRELQQRADSIGRSAGSAMAELLDLNRPASAQDPELEVRLGWSPAYTRRILASLEDAGLLRASNQRTERAGRPRKLYEPKAQVS